MHQEGSSTNFYGTLNEITSKVPMKQGYTFEGWCMEKDSEGNGTGNVIINPTDDPTHYNNDAYYYAKWKPDQKEFTVRKEVYGNMEDKTESFDFMI